MFEKVLTLSDRLRRFADRWIALKHFLYFAFRKKGHDGFAESGAVRQEPLRFVARSGSANINVDDLVVSRMPRLTVSPKRIIRFCITSFATDCSLRESVAGPVRSKNLAAR